MKQFLLLVVLGILVSACISKQPQYYLSQGDTEMNHNDSITLTIQKDDILYISISDVNSGAVSPFNIKHSYLVDNQGYIQFPILGDLQVAGYTKLEAIQYISSKLSPYLKTAIVNLEIKNFKITVLGEVRNPGVFVLNHDKVSIFEILGRAGDISQFGNPEKILIIRKTPNGIQHIRLDITQAGLTSSPYYYLVQNDVVYVEHTKDKHVNYNLSKTAYITSMVASISAAIALVVVLVK